MSTEIPKHHLRQTICATRAPYREGRHGKAVKVYTVNNESSYLIIQGVPSVGATQELSKLCSTFGPVELFNPLDDYPCEDKYTEVYLVKYRKIQSARFAKRKLDDHSFFGGCLHVCYAPEYETVSETRAKLQDRRRIVATKISQQAREASKQISPVITGGHDSGFHTQSFADKAIMPPSMSNSDIQVASLRNGEPQFPSERLPVHKENTVLQEGQSFDHISENRVPSLHIELPDTGQSLFELPLPPKQDFTIKSLQIQKGNKYEFARVPSAHATLPVGYSGQLTAATNHQTQDSNKSIISTTSYSSSILSTTHANSISSISPTAVIVKDYKPSKSTPRFVPRQAMKNKSTGPNQGLKAMERKTDSLDQEIRKNAFQLSETQGPAIIPKRKREPTTPAQQSVQQTIREIRNKISKVISDGVKKQS